MISDEDAYKLIPMNRTPNELDSTDRIRREMVRMYEEALDGRRDPVEAICLVEMLAIIGQQLL